MNILLKNYLPLFCTFLIILNIFCYSKLCNLETRINNLEDSYNYFETYIETMAAINTIPDTQIKNKITKQSPMLFDNNEEMERRIQALETQNRQQQDKLNDVERDAYWVRSELNRQKEYKGQLYKWATDKENQLLNP